MHRGKIIGASVLVLVVAIVLILVQPFSGPEPGEPAAGSPITGGGADAGSQDRAAQASAAVLPPAGASRVYTIDPAGSEVYWRIYRAGAFAAAAHSHVISMTDYSGSVTLTNDLAAAEWTLSFPVGELVIDDPELRARHGEEFESVPSENDKQGTRRNMLTDRLLNGEVYPAITLRGEGVFGSLAEASLPVTIEIVGNSVELRFPAAIELDETAMTVTGETRLSHADLGLTPFSAFGGAIAVADEIDFSYRLHAVAGGQ